MKRYLGLTRSLALLGLFFLSLVPFLVAFGNEKVADGLAGTAFIFLFLGALSGLGNTFLSGWKKRK